MSLAVVTFEEATGADQDTVDLNGYVHLMGSDVHSTDTATGFSSYPLDGSGGGTVYSYERWIRARFDPGFSSVHSFRFLSPTVSSLPAGWSFYYGTADTYATPVNTASTVATAPLPYTDPGAGSPNAGGDTAVDGTATRYSQWIVMQAVLDTTMVDGPGPAYGYDNASDPIMIEFDFKWTEAT